MESSKGAFVYTNVILFAHIVAYDHEFYDLAKGQQLYGRLLIPPSEVIGCIDAANHNICVIV